MNEFRHGSEETIFSTALQLPSPGERAVFLDTACAGNADLRQRIEALLAAQSSLGDFMEDSALTAAGSPQEVQRSAAAAEEGAGTCIGRYKLLQKIGEGGCGAVYMAEQAEPVRRRVALKVIKLGMDTKSVIARFEAERQALAMMDHPNIARVLDAGATQTGRPYFVMELVRGVKITEFCDQNRLSTRERLDLFIQVCQAIQHAHQKGIIHRDIKPSNILVTIHDPGAPGVPKVIDFGIAKATQGRLTDQTLFTAFEQFLGTPAYMSPEQTLMTTHDIDTRSDIYSLGVLLYELLTGKTPFETKAMLASGLDAMRHTIREVQPVRPSTRVRQTGATSRHGPPRAPRPSPLATDLDWIVMKCLEKDRSRRYETANAVAMDLQRHLANEPIVARPPSRLYEFQKSVRRHKVGFAAAATVILVLAAGVLASSWEAARATQAEKKAQAQELAARRRAYASDMEVARNHLATDYPAGALELLDGQRPKDGQQDLRGWEWRYLWQQSRSDAKSTLGHVSGRVSSLAVSADGHWLAVGLNDQGGLSLWDLQTRQESTNLVEDEERVQAAFSPTEPLLAFTSLRLPTNNWTQQFTLHLWNTATSNMVFTIRLTSECAGLAFSRDGLTLVTSTERTPAEAGHLTLWRVTKGGELEELTNYPSDQAIFEGQTWFAATPDLKLAAYAYNIPGQNGRGTRIVDLHNGRELWTAKATNSFLSALRFSRDGKTLASTAGTGVGGAVLTLWNAASGKVIRPIPMRKPPASMVFWPDGTRLASVSFGDQTIRIWDTASGGCVDVLHDQAYVWRLALLPDGKTLVSGGAMDGSICLWDTSITHPRPPHVTIPEKVLTWSFTSDSRSVVTLTQDGRVTQWTGDDFQNGESLLDIGDNFIVNEHSRPFSKDGRFLAVGSANGVLQVWDLPRRVLRRQWTNTAGPVIPLEFQSDGNVLFTWSDTDKKVHKWDLLTGREMLEPLEVPPWTFVGAFSPDGRLAVAADQAGNVWRLRPSDRSQQKLTPAVLDASDVAFSPDGKLVAISSITGVTRVWDTATWHVQATNLYGLFSVAFSPDGKRLATGDANSLAVKLWDTASWKNVQTLEGQNENFHNTAFSPDGNVIGALNQPGTLYLWRAPSWEEIAAAENTESETAHTQRTEPR